MASGGVFSATLHSITTTKLTELSKKRNIFEYQKKTLLSDAGSQPTRTQKLRVLADGVKKSFSIKTATRKRGDRHDGAGRIVKGSSNNPQLEVQLKNLERFLAQAQYDPSISPKLLQDWEDALLKRLDVQSLRYQYATLYGKLVTEWLSSEKQDIPDNVSQTSEGFEKVQKESKESRTRDEGRKEWEKLVFEPFKTDQMAIATYLRDIFGNNGTNKQAIKALDALRTSVEIFESVLATPGQFNVSVLKWVIQGLLASGVLSEEKRAALKDFLDSQVILTEVADVLNMRMASIDTWEWEADVPVEQRRQLNGTHHIFIDEELLQAIFLQFIGVKWSVFFKRAFTTFSNSEGAWASLRQPISIEEKKRREFYIGWESQKPSIQSKRQGLFKSIYFMSQLPNSEYDNQTIEEGEEEAQYDTRKPSKKAKQTAGMGLPMPQIPPQMQQMPMMQMKEYGIDADIKFSIQSAARPYSSGAPHPEYDLEDPLKTPKSPMATKQFLLHLLSTEILVNTKLHGDFTVTRSEFQSWNPSLPHSTIHSVLSFFGLSDKWLRFFHKFLETPLKFVSDGISTEARLRKRGAPAAHALSVVCGEAILFCLDYAVNQKTNGAQLYRMHDDFWIWSSSHETVVKGWQAITNFSETMGVTLNEGKTGTVRIVRNEEVSSEAQLVLADIDSILPSGEIRWGFLYLDPLTGQFKIDDKMVDHHVKELQRQLQDKKSIFAWIQAWNSYAGKFFVSNFGKPANCFGRQHIDSMLETMQRIQRDIFTDSNVVEYLKSTLQERFSITDVPDGYLYFPKDLGGLELHNPFIGLVQLRDSVYEHPQSALDDFIAAEVDAYRQAKLNFQHGRHNGNHNIEPKYIAANTPTFMSFSEFTKYREEFAANYEGNLHSVFCELLEQPTADNVDIDHGDQNISNMAKRASQEGMTEGYWMWVASLYGPDMTERFGELNIVDPGLLPMGMVNLFRSGRVKWEG